MGDVIDLEGPERFECPDCGKMLTRMKNGELRTHKCKKKEPAPQEGSLIDRCIAAYIQTRDEIAGLKKVFDNSVSDLKDLQQKRADYMKGQMDKLGVDNLGCNGVGKVFIDWKDSAKVSARNEFLAWVNEDWEGRNHFIENRVNKTAVKDILNDNQPLPPGIDYVRVKDVKVRRA